MNRVDLIGRLTAKPELRYTASNIAYCRFTIAVDRRPSQNGERGTDFIGCVVWRNQAENLCKYMDKGRQIAIEGRIQTGRFERDGQTVYTTDIVADRIEFLGSRGDSNVSYGSSNSGNSNSAPTPYDFEPSSSSNESSDSSINEDPFADFGDNVSIDDNFLD